MKTVKIPIAEIESMLKYNKKMKAKVLVWSNDLGGLFGFSNSPDRPNALKYMNKKFEIENKVHIPNFVIQDKDLAALVKVASNDEDDKSEYFLAKVNDIHYPNEFIAEIWYKGELKYGYDYFNYYTLIFTTLNEWRNGQRVELIHDIGSIPEFNPVMTAKASDGIIHMVYGNIVYFIPPMVLNVLKKDTVNIEVRRDGYYVNYLVGVEIVKAKGLIERIIFRMMHI